MGVSQVRRTGAGSQFPVSRRLPKKEKIKKQYWEKEKMDSPKVSRPVFPEGYVSNPKGFIAWSAINEKMTQSLHYWVCTCRPNHHPHAVPKWGVWVEERFYFDGSPETRHARNIKQNPYVVVHLESGEHAVIMEGTAGEIKPDINIGKKLSAEYSRKYESLGYSPQPNSWDSGGLYRVVPKLVIAWNIFTEDPTKFEFS